MANSTKVSSSGRAAFSSSLAVIAAVAIAVFTSGVAPLSEFLELSWSLRLVVAWSYVLSLALLAWALREWTGIRWIGHPTLSLVAGVSATSIAAIALAFTLSSSKDQEKKLAEQSNLLNKQLQTMKSIEKNLQTLNESLTTTLSQVARIHEPKYDLSPSIKRPRPGKLGHAAYVEH